MSAPYPAIPFEKQTDPQTTRMCGAACLSMVYRSFGKEVPQTEIWPAISKPNRFGVTSSITHLMALNAISRGFSAVAIQARHPLQVLRLCREGGIRAILNHRLQPDASAGHYSVLVDIDAQGVVLHDPLFGPSRRLALEQLLELWQPSIANSEIVGGVLLAIAAAPPPMPACEFCHTPFPSSVACPRCKRPVGLEPGIPMGCINSVCISRMWSFLCCPSCDYTWTFSQADAAAEEPAAPDSGASGVPKGDPLNPAALFAELDKFLGQIATVPGAAEHPEIKQQLTFLNANKEKLVLARAEAYANRKRQQDQMAAMQQEADQRKAAHSKKMEELNKKSPPLDGDALGHALLKSLGFTK
jgi:hypothetical protein